MFYQDEYGMNREESEEDAILFDLVTSALRRRKFVDFRRIEATVSQGVVTLKGFVKSELQKQVAQYCVESIPGVIYVENLLAVS